MSHAALEADVGGLVGPGAGGETADVLRQASGLARAERMAALLEAAHCDVPREVSACLQAASAALERCGATVCAHALGTATGAFDLPSRRAAQEPGFDAGDATLRALTAVRNLVGAPQIDELMLVMPARAFAHGALLFAHLGVAVDARGGPLAITVRDAAVSLTWADGTRATLPCGGVELAAGAAVGGLAGAHMPPGALVLNACGAISNAFTAFGLASPAQAPALIDAHAEALELLHAVWPQAADMAERFLDGLLLLAPRSGSRSHSCAWLHGAVLSSAENPVTAGDVLCHELAHMRLRFFLERDPLIEDDGAERHVSPWRPDPRPLIGVLLGVHAFLDVCQYYRRLAEHGLAGDVAQRIYDRQSANVRTGMDVLRRHAVATELGTSLLNELEREIGRL